MKKTILGILSVVLLMASCKKNKTDDSKAVTQENIIGNYSLVSITMQSGSSAEQDVTSTYLSDQCERDDVYKFEANGVFELQDAGTVCSPENSYTGNWSLSGTTITSDEIDGTVSQLTSSKLVLTSTENAGGITVTYKTTFNRN